MEKFFESPYLEEVLVFITRNRRGEVRQRVRQVYTSERVKSQMWKAVQKKYPEVEIYQVSRRKAYPPDESKKEPKKLWCPYCSSYRKFEQDEGYSRCEICLITTKDFYTKKYNRK